MYVIMKKNTIIDDTILTNGDEKMARLGVIVHYSPSEGRGVINDVDSHKDISFYCQYVRSDVLRMKLAQANRFGDGEYIFIQPNIYVTYDVCSMRSDEVAGRIEPLVPASANLDLGAPIIGYIQYFGSKSMGGLSGWINPDPMGDEQSSSWFDLSKVIDPALKAYLEANSHFTRSEWRQQEIQVRYWKVDARRTHPSAACIALTDEAIRQKWIKEYNVCTEAVRAWEAVHDRYLFAPDGIVMPAYVELPLQRAPLSMQEVRILNEFRSEAYAITASNPAQRGQLEYLWEIVGHREHKDLDDMLLSLTNIAGTKLAIICRAACSYLNHEYADALEMCNNAQRYDFAAELAVRLEIFGVAQRFAELALCEEVTEKRIQLLGNIAIRTGNALVFGEYYQEMIDAYENGEGTDDEVDWFTEAAIRLLNAVGIDSETMSNREMCCAVREHYGKSISPLRALLFEQQESEKAVKSEQFFTIPTDSLKEPVYYLENASSKAADHVGKGLQKHREDSAALIDDFKRRFVIDERYRLPDRNVDCDALTMIDELLGKELPTINDYRMPLLVRLYLDPDGSVDVIQRYIGRVEKCLDAKRKRYEKDRRWRLFTALLKYVQATNSELRTEAWEKARQEQQRGEEFFLDALPH